ncbi:biotin--[acetyl-CoA-carboxylase] ligase [Sneathiella sp. HT1-7]|uniref:biotin--[acetyl-CoA-carboxylase] ligase n=1 Tax=Sneathiella sp. HT1-7 TaxID=2887192 RepID=UPI001D14FF2A|nr:biotin--[acetyl-CoA-carboxylase] ligase [Sneathiella sp. HT1-7]MCC3306124.1 biotin--[acetyl-CoA-carboxylase] ligase [Sneathiella sp. HT1-7]
MTQTSDGRIDLPPFYTLTVLETTGSTNIEALKLADAGDAEGAIVWAKRQERGVGRRGRQWSSPEGNLYCSLVIRPECDPSSAARLSFLTALAIRRAVSEFVNPDVDVRLKWPNDVLINGHKSAGILLESKTKPDGQMSYVIVGTGVNIATYPEHTDGLPAISLKKVGADVSVPEVLSAYAKAFYDLYMIWKREGFAPIRKEWLANATGLGGRITVKLSKETLEGVFTDLDENGALILSMDNGERKLITAGEVFIVPSART